MDTGAKQVQTYYAVCDVNGPISVELAAESEAAAVAEFASATAADGGQSWIDAPRMDAEDALDIDGSGMSEEAFDAAMRAAGARPVRDLAPVVNALAGTVAHLAGGWYLWEVNGEAHEMRD